MKQLAMIWIAAAAWACQPYAPAVPPASSAGVERAGAQSVRLIAGLGSVHHPVTTSSSPAQKYFDQGLACVYGFNHALAVKSFARAAELDPKLAMAHWGIALALGPNINSPQLDPATAKRAYAESQTALSLSANARPAEKEYINALARRYSADPKADGRKLALAYKQAMGEVLRRHPDDLDAAALYAESMMDLRPWKLYAKDGRPEEGTGEIVKVLEWALARNPKHIGANHYYIHAVEASNHPERALAAARRLPELAPAAGHLVHMPAHVYIRTGDYAAAIAANQAAAQVDEQAASCCVPRAGGGADPAMYYMHNLHFLAAAAAMAGQSRAAGDAAAKLAAHIDGLIDRAPALEAFGAIPLLIAARQAQWGDILKWPQPKANRHATLAAWHFARGMAHAAMKDIGPALRDHDLFEAQAAKARDLSMGNNPAGAVLAVADHLLSGKVFAARGDAAAARRELELAVKAQDQLDYDEPPAFPWPVREALGALLLKAGDAQGAEKVFRDDLARTPNNPRSLMGLSQSLKARGKHYDAAEVMKQALERWKDADMKLGLEEF